MDRENDTVCGFPCKFNDRINFVSFLARCRPTDSRYCYCSCE